MTTTLRKKPAHCSVGIASDLIIGWIRQLKYILTYVGRAFATVASHPPKLQFIYLFIL